MDRRQFIRNSMLISGGVLAGPSLIAAPRGDENYRLTILHTNDTHSNIDPFPDNHSRYPGKGGVARRFELIQKIRSEEKHVLLLDAGDIFQGTPYFNRYKGTLEMKLMTEMGYEAATMGNHDFDIGIDGFINAQKFADFPFLCSNYDFTNTALDGLTTKFKVIRKGNLKVGLFGLGVELKGLVPNDKFKETKYLDPIEIANEQAKFLKEKGCDLIICLSHLGYSYDSDKVSDVKIAENTRNIHLVIGGHTHTFLDEPTQLKNLDDETVLVNQVGWAGVNLGRIDFHMDSKSFAKKNVIHVK